MTLSQLIQEARKQLEVTSFTPSGGFAGAHSFRGPEPGTVPIYPGIVPAPKRKKVRKWRGRGP